MKISSALLSVSDKVGVVELAKGLCKEEKIKRKAEGGVSQAENSHRWEH